MIDKDAFLAGVEKKANELLMPKSLVDHMLKCANIFATTDSIDSLLGSSADFSDKGFDFDALKNHVGKAGLAGGAAGGALGSTAGLAGKKNNTRNAAIGAGAGALVGSLSGGVNDLYRLVDNSRTSELSKIQEQMSAGQLDKDFGQQAIDQINSTPWYKYYGF